MNQLLYTTDEQALFSEALKYGRAYVDTLNAYQKARLRDFAREKQYHAIQVNTSRLQASEQPQNKLDYWLESAPAYTESRDVLALLTESTAPTVTAATAATAATAPAAAPATAVAPAPAGARELSLRQIALLHIYRGETIASGVSANQIAQQYGHTSGEKLVKHYNALAKAKDRLATEAGRKLEALIKDIETVLPHLVGEGVKLAELEILTLGKRR